MDVNGNGDGGEDADEHRNRQEPGPTAFTQFEAAEEVCDGGIHGFWLLHKSPVRGRQHTATNTDCDSQARMSSLNAIRSPGKTPDKVLKTALLGAIKVRNAT